MVREVVSRSAREYYLLAVYLFTIAFHLDEVQLKIFSFQSVRGNRELVRAIAFKKLEN